MPLNTDCVGRRYPDTAPYEVARQKVREFAQAIGDDNELYFDAEAARAAGYRDVIAPPTFAITITQPATRQASFDPDVGLDYTKVLHGEQRFVHHEPLCAGDTVVARTTIVEIRRAGANWRMTTETTLHRLPDETLVCTATSSLIERDTAGAG